jgi:hypothetical protein
VDRARKPAAEKIFEHGTPSRCPARRRADDGDGARGKKRFETIRGHWLARAKETVRSLSSEKPRHVLLIQVKARFFSRRQDDTKRRDVMPAVDAVIVAAIVAAFVIFAGVLAWVEHQTRDLPRFEKPAGGRTVHR